MVALPQCEGKQPQHIYLLTTGSIIACKYMMYIVQAFADYLSLRIKLNNGPLQKKCYFIYSLKICMVAARTWPCDHSFQFIFQITITLKKKEVELSVLIL